MPISNPSYFPPQRSNGSVVGVTAGLDYNGARAFLEGQDTANHSTLNDIIMLGDHIAPNGVTDPLYTGSIAIGSQAMQNLTESGGGSTPEGPNLVIGFNALQNLSVGSDYVVLGNNAAVSVRGELGSPSSSGVIIGNRAAQLAGAAGPSVAVRTCVVIGNSAGKGNGLSGINGATIIGYECAQSFGELGSNGVESSVLICDAGGFPSLLTALNVYAVGNHDGSTVSAICALGSNNLQASNNSVSIGVAQNSQMIYAVSVGNQIEGNLTNCVILGSGANNGPGLGGNLTNALLIETGQPGLSGVPRRLLLGDFGAQDGTTDGGNLILGDAHITATAFLASMQNCTMLCNGVKGTGGNPVGGGYFYVTAGQLHYVDSGGFDTKLSSGATPANFPQGVIIAAAGLTVTAGLASLDQALAVGLPGGGGDAITTTPSTTTGALIATSAPLTDYSGAQLATLTNAPVAGNPVKWLALNDGGTIRRWPTW